MLFNKQRPKDKNKLSRALVEPCRMVVAAAAGRGSGQTNSIRRWIGRGMKVSKMTCSSLVTRTQKKAMRHSINSIKSTANLNHPNLRKLKISLKIDKTSAS